MIKVDVYLHACKDEDGEEWKEWGTGGFMVVDVLSKHGVSLEDFQLISEALEVANELDNLEHEPEQWYRLSMRMEDHEVEYYPERFRREWYYYIMTVELIDDPETQVCEPVEFEF